VLAVEADRLKPRGPDLPDQLDRLAPHVARALGDAPAGELVEVHRAAGTEIEASVAQDVKRGCALGDSDRDG
jgi:hypothetical protein